MRAINSVVRRSEPSTPSRNVSSLGKWTPRSEGDFDLSGVGWARMFQPLGVSGGNAISTSVVNRTRPGCGLNPSARLLRAALEAYHRRAPWRRSIGTRRADETFI